MKLSVLLTESEMVLLRQVAARNSRRPQDQARWFIVESLKQYAKDTDKLDQLPQVDDESSNGS
jgi:hypothetical protein